MSDHLIVIDGYNLILRAPALRPGPGRTLQGARDKLINLLSWTVGSGEARFLVIFDGAELSGGPVKDGRVEVRYSKPPRKADDDIRDLVEDQVDRVERLTVVTSDLEVARHARAMGATVTFSDIFLASVLPAEVATAPGEKPAGLSKKEIEEWAEVFRSRGPAPREDDEPGA